MSTEKKNSSNNNQPLDISCLDIFNRFSYCSSPRIQFSHFAAHGEFENCSVYFGDWTNCMKYRLVTDSEKKEAIKNQLYVVNRPKVVNDTWTYKKTPCWGDEPQNSTDS